MYALLEEILAEIKGLRADIKTSNEASDAWMKGWLEAQRKGMEEVLARGRRMELRSASMSSSN